MNRDTAWRQYREGTGPIALPLTGKRFLVTYSFDGAPDGAWYSGGEFRFSLVARMQAWTILDLGWSVRVVDRKTGKMLDGLWNRG